MSSKRKRKGAAQGFKRRKIRHITGLAPRPFVRGYDRVGGFYGRFAPAGELKFFDIDVDDASITSAGTIQTSGSINTIAQGVTESTRVGRKCTIRKILWRYKVALDEVDGAANPGDPDTVRLILYMDRQANGAAAAVTDILESDDYQSFNNLANNQRFSILMDRTVAFGHQAGGGNGTASDWAGVEKNGTFFKSCNIPLEFDSTTGAITEIRSNNLAVLTLASTGGRMVLDSKVRLRFSDS